MSIKVIAMGNILMKDDGIGIEVAKEIKEKLSNKEIEVILGETDTQYIISRLNNYDDIIVLDAVAYGKNPGDIIEIPINTFTAKKSGVSQHSYSFLDLIKLYYPFLKGIILGIEVQSVEFGLGLSFELQEKLERISEEIIMRIEKYIESK